MNLTIFDNITTPTLSNKVFQGELPPMEIYRDTENRIEIDLKFVRPSEIIAFKGSNCQKLDAYATGLVVVVVVTHRTVIHEPEYIQFTTKDEAKKLVKEYLNNKFNQLGIQTAKLTKFGDLLDIS